MADSRSWALCGLALLLALSCAFVGRAASQITQCTRRDWGVAGSELAVGNFSSEARALGPRACDLWTLTPASIAAHPSCLVDDGGSSSPGYLLFEFWRLDARGVLPDEEHVLTDSYFLIAKGVQPNVTLSGSQAVYVSPRTAPARYTGTLQDADADTYMRTYHRILVPRNAASNRPGTPAADTWFVTVANLEQQLSLPSYKVRVSCLPSAAAAPCPTPLFAQPPCSGRGACSLPPRGYTSPDHVCLCEDGWGDYGCQRPTPLLSNGAVTTAVIQPNAWAFWQLRVPLPAAGVSALPWPPALLVELNRGGAGGAAGSGLPGASDGGGDPVLLVMPKPRSGSNQVPWFSDVTAYADLNSYFLQQDFHYRLLRNAALFQPAPLSPPANNNTNRFFAEFYVAVYNNDQRFSPQRQPLLTNAVANVTLRVRWTDLTAAAAPPLLNATAPPSPPPLCPGDCFGRGTCYDPQDPAANTGSLPPPLLPPPPPVSGSSVKPLDFQCACRGDAGGTLCEGSLARTHVTLTSDYLGQHQLLPGQWQFIVVQLSNETFDYRAQQLTLRWLVNDASPANASMYYNAVLTVNEQGFPRDADLSSALLFRRGWQIFYSSLTQRANPPLPLVIRGTDITPGLSYVFGLYNSDYVRQMPYNTTFEIRMDAAPPPPQPPRPPTPPRPPRPPPRLQNPPWPMPPRSPVPEGAPPLTAPPPEGGKGPGGAGQRRRLPPPRVRRLPPPGAGRKQLQKLPA